MNPEGREARRSRFELCKPTSEESRSGTLKELLAEINHERNPESGTEVDLKSLEPTLAFIGALTGRSYRSTNEVLPMSTLATIKLLYDENEESGIQLYQLLKAPQQGAKPTLEVRTTGSSSRNAYGTKVLNDLLKKLSVGVSDDRLHHIETSLLTASKLLECIELENREILGPIYWIHGTDEAAIVIALGQLTQLVKNYPMRRTSVKPALDELVYTHIRTLPFLHFVSEYKEILDTARVDNVRSTAAHQLERFCATLRTRFGSAAELDAPVTSLAEFSEFFNANANELIRLVKAITGLPVQLRDLNTKHDEAAKILHMFVFHQHGRMPLDARLLSVADCIAALCTIRHQQVIKTNYSAYWPGQKSSEIRTRPLGQLENGRGIEELYEEDYIPHGVSQFLYSRFCQFHAQLTDQQARYEAFQAFQLARLDTYAECLLFNGVSQIDANLIAFDEYCKRNAISLAGSTPTSDSLLSINAWLQGE